MITELKDQERTWRESGGVAVSGQFCVLAEWLTVCGLPLIGAYVDPTAPVRGFIEPANKLAVFAPWLVLFGLVDIGTAVVVAWKRRFSS